MSVCVYVCACACVEFSKVSFLFHLLYGLTIALTFENYRQVGKMMCWWVGLGVQWLAYDGPLSG